MVQTLKKKRKGGFTLIELIVVIAILGILALIAIPRLGGFTNDAQDAADLATARTIASAVSMAEAQNGSAVTLDNVRAHLSGVTIADANVEASNTWGVALTVTDGVLSYTITSPDGGTVIDNDSIE